MEQKGKRVFSNLVVAYLFLGGTGAGCCLVSSVLALLSEPDELEGVLASRMRSNRGLLWMRFFASIYIAALAFLLLGAICLLADLGRPDRLLSMLFQPAPGYVSFGAWSIVACMAASAFCIMLWTGRVPSTRRQMAVACAVAAASAAAVVAYTGLMLFDMRAVPVWSTPWLVALFLTSALSCGIALSVVAAFASRTMAAFASTLVGLARADAVIIAVEAAVGILCLLSVWEASGGSAGPADGTGHAAVASLQSLLAGSDAALFWVGFVLVGLAMPFVNDVVIGRSGSVAARRVNTASNALFALGTAVCVLVGGFVLRLLFVGAALHPVAALAY